MSYAVCRSAADAMPDPGTGQPHVRKYKGYTIDPTVGPGGGILVDSEAEALALMGPNNSPNRLGWFSMPVHDDPAAERRRPSLFRVTEYEKANVRLGQIANEAADPESDKGRALAVLERQCKQLITKIDQERAAMAARIEAKLSAGKTPAPDAPEAVKMPFSPPQTAPEATPGIEASLNPMRQRKVLRERCKALRAAGGPPLPKLNSKTPVLVAYIEAHGETV